MWDHITMRNAYRYIGNDPLSRLGAAQRAYAAMNEKQTTLRAQLTIATAAHRLGLTVVVRQSNDRTITLNVGAGPKAASFIPSHVALATLGSPDRVAAMMDDPSGEGERLVAEFLERWALNCLKLAGNDVSSIEAGSLSSEVIVLDPSLRVRRRGEMPARVPTLMESVHPEERDEARLRYEAEYDDLMSVVDLAVGPAFPPAMREVEVDDLMSHVWLSARTLPEVAMLRVDREAFVEGSRYAYLRLQGALARAAIDVHEFFGRMKDNDVDGIARRAMLEAYPQPLVEKVYP